MAHRATVVFAIVTLLIAFGIGLSAWWFTRADGALQQGEALVGGPFELTDQDGKRVTDKDFRGRYMLVAFGYTFCPDVCPSELQVMSAALDKLGKDAERVQPVFVSIDPERDAPKVMKNYVANFRPGFMGLTGSADDIAKAASAYRVYYARAKGFEDKADYLMDHSALIFLMGPDGKYVKFFPYSTDAEQLARDIKAAMASNS